MSNLLDIYCCRIDKKSNIFGCKEVYNEIIEHLYLGGEESQQFVKDNNIKLVIDIRNNGENKTNIDDIEYINIRINDNTDQNISIYFDEITQKIHEYILNGKNVLVHCMAGISRSATMVMAYLIRYYGFDTNNVFDFVVKKRSCINPNLGFLGQLLLYYEKINGLNI